MGGGDKSSIILTSEILTFEIIFQQFTWLIPYNIIHFQAV